jgi:hypothetical protein
MTAIFQHTPLGEDEIRLCRVKEQRIGTGYIAIELNHFPKRLFDFQKDDNSIRFDDSLLGLSNQDVASRTDDEIRQSPSEYTALSYTWGDPGSQLTIYIDETPFRILQNLHDFLTTLHDMRDHSTWFWIDQLSINQCDIAERNHEVQRMAQIYGNAASVRVWLGLANEHTESAFALLERYVAMVRQRIVAEAASYRNECLDELDKLELLEDLWGMENVEELNRIRAIFLQESSRLWKQAAVLSSFFTNIYWSRQWIAQEIWFARHLVLQSGRTTLIGHTPSSRTVDSWESCKTTFLSALDWANDHWAATERQRKFRPQGVFKHRVGTPGTLRLPFALDLYQGDCHDVRDKVFALMGMVDSRQRVVIDYSMSVIEVYWATVYAAYRGLSDEQSAESIIVSLKDLAVRMDLLSTVDPWCMHVRPKGDLCFHEVLEYANGICGRNSRAWPPIESGPWVHVTVETSGCICEKESYQRRLGRDLNYAVTK